MKAFFRSLAAVLLVHAAMFSPLARGTTWDDSQLTDPLTGEKVASQDFVTYGGYIYDWPSKFDIVFWPLTAEEFTCLNPKNGYAAFNDDFEEVPEEKRPALKKWLAENFDAENAPKTHKEKLLWLEKVYAQRDPDDDFWSMFYRLMAHLHEDEPDVHLAYVKKALPLLEKKLQADPEWAVRIETLYLLGEYKRRVGEVKQAREFFAQVKTAKYKDENDKEQTGHPYFLKLLEDREKLQDGQGDAADRK